MNGGEGGGGAPVLFDFNTFKDCSTKGATFYCSDDLNTFPVHILGGASLFLPKAFVKGFELFFCVNSKLQQNETVFNLVS